MNKIKSLIIILFLISNSINAQKRDFDFCIEQLNHFTKNKNIDYQKVYKEDLRTLIVFRDGVILNLSLNKNENEDVVNHEMHFNYFFPKKYIKNSTENDPLSILKVLYDNVSTNSFALKEFVLESIKGAMNTKQNNIEKQNSFKIFSTVKNQSSEVIFTIENNNIGLNCLIDFYISL